MKSPDGLGDVRPQHRFDTQRLEQWLVAHVPGLSGPIAVKQFRGGQSNPTFLVTGSRGVRCVVRKQPPGKLLRGAHRVDREYRVMAALAATQVPVPRTYALCEDHGIIGTSFYAMDFVQGRVLRDTRLPQQDASGRRAVYLSLIDTLARLHQVDPVQAGLGDYGRRGGYLARQIQTWTTQYRAAETETIPAMERVIAWLPEHIPDEDPTCIAHGDFRLENTIFHPTEPRVIAVLDWELSTLGHPLADLAYSCLPYFLPRELMGFAGHDLSGTGIPTVEEYLDAYCSATGRGPVSAFSTYVAFSLFRLAAIAQGVYRRGLAGNASSDQASQFGEHAKALAALAWHIADTRAAG